MGTQVFVASAKPEGGEGLASSKNLQVLGRHQLVMALGHAMRLVIFIAGIIF